MKRDNVILRAKLVVRYRELVPMESGAELSAMQDTSTVRVTEERRAVKKKRNHWLSEANWPRLKEVLLNIWYPYLRVQCDEACLELGLHTAPKQKVFNVLRRIGRNTISYENVFPELLVLLLNLPTLLCLSLSRSTPHSKVFQEEEGEKMKIH